MESRSAAVGIEPCQTLSCPCPRELWQSVASALLPNPGPGAATAALPPSALGGQDLTGKWGFSRAASPSFHSLLTPGSGGVDCDKWQMGQDDCDHCTPGLQVLGTVSLCNPK